MKYTNEEALEEILRRGEALARRRDRRISRVLSGTAGALFALLALVIAALPGQHIAEYGGTVYGAFLLPSEAGGYVLAALLAFAAGVAITLLILRRQRRIRKSDETEDRRP